MRRLAVLIGVGLGFAGAAPAGAAVTFGTDLAAHPANEVGNCAQPPPGYFLPQNSPSCMFSFVGVGAGAPTLTAPASGRVSKIRVKVGSVTGPMRVNVIRFLFQQTGDPAHPTSAGPFLEAYGPEFTPAANSVTTVPTDLQMTEDPTPPISDTETIQVIDALALEVESNQVPVPLFSDGASLTYPVFPGPTAAGVVAPSPNGLPTYGTYGYAVLMNGDLDPGAALALRSATIPVAGGVAKVPLQCALARCEGVLALQKAAGTRRASVAKVVSYGRAKFAAKAGKKFTVKVKLNKAGRRLVKRKKSVVVTARATFAKRSGKPQSYPVTLAR